MSKSRLLSGRVPKKSGADLDESRFEFLDLASAEPDLGQPNFDGAMLISNADGSRYWTDNIRIDLTGNIAVGTISNSDGSSAIAMIDDVVMEDNLTVQGIFFAPTISTQTINTIDSSNLRIESGLIVEGDLTVQGTTTTINSTTLAIEDKNIELAKGATSAAEADGAGITVLGPTTSASLLYDAATDSWLFNKDIRANLIGSATGNIFTSLIDSLDSSAVTFVPQVVMNSDLTVENNIYVDGDVTATNFNGTLKGNVVVDSGISEFNDIKIKGVLVGDVLTAITAGNLQGDILSANGVKILENGTDGTDAAFTGTVTGNVFTNRIDSPDSSEITINTSTSIDGDLRVSNDLNAEGTIYAERVFVRDTIVGTFEGAITGPEATGLFQQLITNGIDSLDSSPIRFIPGILVESDLTVENNAYFQNDVTAQRFIGFLQGQVSDISNHSIDDLNDVDISTLPLNNQTLVWNAAENKFVPGDSFSQADFDTAFGNKSVGDLSDVDITTTAPTDGQPLVWNTVEGKFVPGQALGVGSSVEFTSITADIFTNSIDSPDSSAITFVPQVIMNSDLNVENNVYVTVDVTARKFLGDVYAQVVKSVFGEFDSIVVNGVQIGTIQGSTRGDLIGDILADDGTKILENGLDGTDAVFTGSVIGSVTGQVSDISNHSVGDLSDVDITTAAPTNGQSLVWNASLSKFVPGGQGVGTTDNVTFNSLTVQSLDVATIGSPDSTAINVVNSTVFASDVTVDNNLVVQGNLTVLGTETVISTVNLIVEDPIIYLAEGNQSNVLDLGFAGSFNNGIYQHTGLIRDASDNIWRLFSNYLPEPEEPLDFTNVTYDDLKLGTLIADQVNAQYVYGEIITNLIDSADSSPIIVTPKLVASTDLEVQNSLIVATTAVVGESVSSLLFIGELQGNVTGQVSDISNHSLGDLSDVDLFTSPPEDLNILTWDAGQQKWVASGLSDQGLFTTSNVTFASLTADIYTNYIVAPDSGDIVAANRFIGTHDIVSENNIYSQNDIIATRNVEAEKFVGYLDGAARDIDDTALTNKEFATELDIDLDQVFVYDVSAGELKKTYLSEIVSSGAAGYTGSAGEPGYTGSSGDPGYTGSRGLGLDEWIKITANYTAESGNRIIADTTAGAFTITLPVTPDLGAYIVLTDGGDWSINPLTISAGGASIEGYTEDVIIDIGGVTTELLWDGTMWQITATLGAAGNPGPGVPDGGTTGQVLAKVSNTDYDTAWVNPTGGGANLGSLEVTGSVISTTDSSPVTIDRSLIVDGDLLPESDSLYDLGSPTKKWHSLYVSGNSIYINDTALTVDQNGDLLVGGQLPQSNISALEDIPDVVVSGATVGQVLGYTGSNWTATTVEGGGGGADSYVKTYFWEGALQENVSLKRFYIHVASTLEKITVNLGTAGLTQSTIQIKRNGQVLNSIVIPANTVYVLETVDHPLAVNDYLTVDITQSSSAANLYVTFVYRE